MAFETSVHAKALALIRWSIEMTTAAGSGHPTSAASLAHLVTLLMYNHMRYDPAYPNQPTADRLVLSEGHACPIIYAAAADLGIAIGKEPEHWRPMTRDDALQLRAITSEIDGHPNPARASPSSRQRLAHLDRACQLPTAWHWRRAWMVLTGVFSASLAMEKVGKGRSGKRWIFWSTIA